MRNAVRDYHHGLIDENRGNPEKVRKTIDKVLEKNETSVKLSSVEVDGKCLTQERDVLFGWFKPSQESYFWTRR